MDTAVYLIDTAKHQNEIGAWVATETRREILATIGSISRSEWNSAGNTGFKPALVVKTPSVNYNGQLELEVDGARYGIYRTYNDAGDGIELYCERKAGVGHVDEDG